MEEGVPRKVWKACQASRGLSAAWQLTTFDLPRGTAERFSSAQQRGTARLSAKSASCCSAHPPTLFGLTFLSHQLCSERSCWIYFKYWKFSIWWHEGWGDCSTVREMGLVLKYPSEEDLIWRYPCERVLISNCPLCERTFDVELCMWKGSNLAGWGSTSPNRGRAERQASKAGLLNNLERLHHTTTPALASYLELELTSNPHLGSKSKGIWSQVGTTPPNKAPEWSSWQSNTSSRSRAALHQVRCPLVMVQYQI